VVGALVVFGLGALAVGLVVRGNPDDVALKLALPLLVLGLGSGAIITPNQALSLADVDPRMGGAAGGVLQTAQRIGSAIGQAVVGAVFFAALGGSAPTGSPAYGPAMAACVLVMLAFVAAALVLGVTDVLLTRRRNA
jgi:MFS family permease